MFDFEEHFKRINEGHKKKEVEIQRLMADPPKEMPIVDDKVIIAAGLLGHGWEHIRREGVVTQVGDNTIKVKWNNYPGHSAPDFREEWMHPAFITDILKSN